MRAVVWKSAHEVADAAGGPDAVLVSAEDPEAGAVADVPEGCLLGVARRAHEVRRHLEASRETTT